MNHQFLQRLIAVAAALLLAGGGLFLWLSADRGEAVTTPGVAPTAPEAAAMVVELPAPAPDSAASREEKRFARWDRDDDGRIDLAEYLYNRRRTFDRLDANGDGVLSFDEYAKSGIDKFRKTDASRDGFLSPVEFATTAPRPKVPVQTADGCNCAPTASPSVAALQQDDE